MAQPKTQQVTSQESKGPRSRLRRVVAIAAVIGVPALAGVGVYLWNDMFGLGSSTVDRHIPEAPRLQAASEDETVFRIDAARSEASYEIGEALAGKERTAVGATKAIAGDVMVDSNTPSRSKVGEIVIDVEQLTSDQTLRDRRIRKDFLESSKYPLARFSTRSISGMPDSIESGRSYEVELSGDLTLKDETKPVTLMGTAQLDADELKLVAHGAIKLSDFGIGPIRIVGLVSASDDARLKLDITAVNEADATDAEQVAVAAPESPAVTGGPSFAKSIQPVLERSCAGCHSEGEPGSHFWELSTAEDAQGIGEGLALVTQSGFMPPWLATDKSIEFEHDPTLTGDELQSISDWVSAGSPLDVEPNTAIDVESGSQIRIDHDQVLVAPGAYQGSTDKTNDYRCMVMAPVFDGPTVVRGLEFLPDQRDHVHHALVFRVSAEKAEKFRERDASEAGEGYECFGAGGGDGADLVMSWAPGQAPLLFEEGVGLAMGPGDIFVTQIHYHFVDEAPADRSEVALQTETDAEAVAATKDVQTDSYVAPAEIPCTDSESGPLCARAAVIADIGEKYGPAGPTIANGIHFLCGTTVDELAVLDGTKARTSCEHRPRPGKVVSIFGHMHEIGTKFRMTLNPGTPEERVLLDIDEWDFAWQLTYDPKENLVLDRDDVIRVECEWDRTLIDPDSEPRWVTWSEGTEDEMCYSTISVTDE